MGKSQHFIEINGKKYDAQTGAQLGVPTLAANPPVDGIVRRKVASTPRSVQPAKRQSTQRSQTLMRTVVKKPVSNKAAHPATTPKPISKEHLGLVTPHEVSEERLERAHKVSKSPLISRFSFSDMGSSILKKVQPLTVREHPSQTHHHPAPQKAESHHTSAAAVNSKTTSHPMIEKALARADSHNQAAHPIKKHSRLRKKLGLSRRAAAVGTSLVAMLILGGFFAYQNVPNFAMRIASARAGFSANMPDYQPSGFSYKGPIKYSPGEVVVNFKSNTADDRTYTLTERKTNWNSDALLVNHVMGQDSEYQTFLENEHTIYTYEDDNASWVKDGVWYELESGANLTSEQILNIAKSL